MGSVADGRVAYEGEVWMRRYFGEFVYTVLHSYLYQF